MRQKGLVKLLVNLKFCEETSIRSKRDPEKGYTQVTSPRKISETKYTHYNCS